MTTYQTEVIHNFLLDKFGKEYVDYLIAHGEGKNLIRDINYPDKHIYDKERKTKVKP